MPFFLRKWYKLYLLYEKMLFFLLVVSRFCGSSSRLFGSRSGSNCLLLLPVTATLRVIRMYIDHVAGLLLIQVRQNQFRLMQQQVVLNLLACILFDLCASSSFPFLFPFPFYFVYCV
mgnify:CR=1 FL=1